MTWTETNNAIEADFIFEDFKQAFAFMTECAMYAEQANHHPTWENTWNKVHVRLQTHDAGNIVTEKDRELARKMDHAYEKYMKI
jgi:4a-hydroxytetrahydrobiopterin dehydratase